VNRGGVVTGKSLVGIDECGCQKLLLLSIESCQLLILTDLSLELLELLEKYGSVGILPRYHLGSGFVHFSDILLDYHSHLCNLYH
jgi:hypothetical protein